MVVLYYVSMLRGEVIGSFVLCIYVCIIFFRKPTALTELYAQLLKLKRCVFADSLPKRVPSKQVFSLSQHSQSHSRQKLYSWYGNPSQNEKVKQLQKRLGIDQKCQWTANTKSGSAF